MPRRTREYMDALSVQNQRIDEADDKGYCIYPDRAELTLSVSIASSDRGSAVAKAKTLPELDRMTDLVLSIVERCPRARWQGRFTEDA